MRKYYIIVGILSVVVLTVTIMVIATVGGPFAKRNNDLDNTRINNITSIKYSVESYYRTHQQLPSTLYQLPSTVPTDPQTKKAYDYVVINGITYKLCTVFSTDATQGGDIRNASGNTELDVIYTSDNGYHKKGYDCITYDVASLVNYNNYPTNNYEPPVAPITTSTTLQNPDFEILDSMGTFQNWELVSGQLNRSGSSFTGKYAAEFVSGRNQQVITSDPITAVANSNLSVSLWYKTESKCTNCGFVGFKFIDKQGNEITDEVTDCGTYNNTLKSWATYLPKGTSNYNSFTTRCTLPYNAYAYAINLGLWNSSDVNWLFDNIKVSTIDILY